MDVIRFGSAARLVGLMGIVGAAAPALGYVDLLHNQSVTLGQAVFQRGDLGGNYSTPLNAFARLNTTGAVEQGYNTSAGANNQVSAGANVTYGQLRTVNVGGVAYKEFILNINESSTTPFLSMDKLQIYTSSVGGQSTANPATLGTLRYDMDSLGDNYVALDSRIDAGLDHDMAVLIPESFFGNTLDSQYVYLFSRFGDHNGNDGGFEEWSIAGVPTVPLPAAAWTGLSGFLCILVARRHWWRRC